jgi:hypothetical protein
VPAQTTATASGLVAGTYTVTVTDDEGCSAIASVTINQPAQIGLTMTKVDVSCFGGNDGSATVTVSGGSAPFTYLWNTVPAQTTATASGIVAGTYTVTVTDDEGCSATASVTINQPAQIDLTMSKVDVSCFGGNDGSATVTVSGGSAPFTYLWNTVPAQTTATASGLVAGTYTVTVTDDEGCSNIGVIVLEESMEPCDCEVTIGDFVWYDFNKNGIQDNNELGINGIPVYLVEAGSDGEYGTPDDVIVQNTVTKGSGQNTGYYFFNQVCEGTYAVCWEIDTLQYFFTFPNLGGDPAKDSDANPMTGCSFPFTITNNSGDDLTIDAGLIDRCIELTYPGEIGYDQVLCFPGEMPMELVETVGPIGGPDDYEYMWLYTTDQVSFFPGGANWIEISNTNYPNYQPGPLSQTTYFIRCIRHVGCTNWYESNIIEIEIVNPEAVIIAPTSQVLCANTNFIFRARDNGQGATYFWDFGLDATPATANSRSVNNVSWSTTGFKTITLTVTVDGCTVTETYIYEIEPCNCKPIIQTINTSYTNEMPQVDISWYFDAWFEDHQFIISRSLDGINFKFVDLVTGKKMKELSYLYTDTSPYAGRSYYRITMQDIAGNIEHSTVEEVNVGKLGQSNIRFFPNPASSYIIVDILDPLNEEGEIHFFDALGKLIHVQTISPDVRRMEFDISGWSDGPVLAYIYQKNKRPYSILFTKLR